MRISHQINPNTFVTYEASPDSLSLIGEGARQIVSENFHWDDKHCPALTTFCVQTINANFTTKPLLDELPCHDCDYLLEILDVNLALEFVIPLIEDEIYWKRRYEAKFGKNVMKKTPGWTWKGLFLERYMQEVLENAQSEHNDEYQMDELLTLCAPYVRRLVVTQLQAWKPPLQWDEEDIPEFYPTDHISFEPIFKKLTNITEFSLVFGMKNVSDNFNWNMFKVSVQDCQRLGKAINHLKFLKILKIRKSNLEDAHIRVLMQGFIKNESVEELDFSHCCIENQGALCIAKILTVHPKLRSLTLCDNKIGRLGCEGLGFALLQPDCSLEKLNLKLNPLGEGGAMGILRALVRGTNLKELSLAACGYVDDAALRTAQMLLLNSSLKRLDISNNWFDEDGGKALVDAMAVNTTLEWLDFRETDVTIKQYRQIQKYLQRNRSGSEEVIESGSEDDEGEFTQADVVAEKTEKPNLTSEEGEAAPVEQ